MYKDKSKIQDEAYGITRMSIQNLLENLHKSENKASRILFEEFNHNKSQESQKYVWKNVSSGHTWQTHVAEYIYIIEISNLDFSRVNFFSLI